MLCKPGLNKSIICAVLCWMPWISGYSKDTVVRGVFAVSPTSSYDQVVDYYEKVYELLSAQLFLESDKREKRSELNIQPWNRISRKELTRSHPYAILSTGTPEVKAGKQAGSMIKAIQQELESKALNQAVVMDCKTKKALIISCGLYLYDRAEGRIIASSTKRFSVGIPSAVAWAAPMTEHFNKGLATIEDRKIKKMIDNMSTGPREVPEESPLSMAGLFGQIGLKMTERNETPVLGAIFSHGSQKKKLNLSARFYRGNGTKDGLPFTESGQGFFVGAVGSSDRIHGVLWELGLDAGVWNQKMNYDRMRLQRTMMTFLIYPALRIPLTRNHHTLIRYDYGWSGILSQNDHSDHMSLRPRSQGIMFAYQVVL